MPGSTFAGDGAVAGGTAESDSADLELHNQDVHLADQNLADQNLADQSVTGQFAKRDFLKAQDRTEDPGSAYDSGEDRYIWHRVVLKLSGAAFAGGNGERLGIDPDVVLHVAGEIRDALRLGVQVAAVVGGGNMFRGDELAKRGIDRARADYMGMLGTVMN